MKSHGQAVALPELRSDRGLFVCFQLLPAATAPRAPLLQLGWRARPAAHVQGVPPMLLSAWPAPTAQSALPLLLYALSAPTVHSNLQLMQAAQVPSL